MSEPEEPASDPLVTIKIPSSRLRDMMSALSQVVDRGFVEPSHFPVLRELRDALTVEKVG
jgi:hypothetical protein